MEQHLLYHELGHISISSNPGNAPAMLRILGANKDFLRTVIVCNVRCFSTQPSLLEKPLPPRPKIIETEIEEAFLKGSGPGGQKINKTSSAVQIKHLPSGIVVKSQETRSRPQNRKLARQILAEKLDQLEKGDESRTAIKSERATKKKASASKKTRRKYKKLDGEKAAGDVGGEDRRDGSVISEGVFVANEAMKKAIPPYESDRSAFPKDGSMI